jgi:hypothetical protein
MNFCRKPNSFRMIWGKSLHFFSAAIPAIVSLPGAGEKLPEAGERYGKPEAKGKP